MDRARPPQTIVEDAGELADEARQILADAGALPHRVFVVVYHWSGGEKGRGEPQLHSFRELTPPPEVTGEGRLRRKFTAGGTTLEGTVKLEAISPRYTEADLDVLLRPMKAGEEVFIEVVHDGRDGAHPERRAYRPVSKPERRPLDFDWSMELEKSDDNRGRYGNRRYWSRE